jgi:DNA-binding transcriptional LysR family regulator
MDRLKALSVFKAVADHGSFVAAASALDIPCSGNLLQSYNELTSIGRLSASEPAGVIRMAAPASADDLLPVTGGRVELKQVVLNLLLNALRAGVRSS